VQHKAMQPDKLNSNESTLVNRPVKFEMVINGKTATALGIAIPPIVLAQVDEMIE
jgi:ABC-type uncharacterized transport system substrate-binding protein